jgi:hypothetical protein
VAETAWELVSRLLRQTAEAGPPPGFWWRDDDCAGPSRALDQLLEVCTGAGVPVVLAAVPLAAESLTPLAERLNAFPPVTLAQHGAYHRNHSPSARVATEIGGFRPLSTILDELRRGREALLTCSPQVDVAPVLVPPWNRIRADVVPHLHGLGFRGLSTRGRRPHRTLGTLIAANVHLDPIDWSEPTPRFEEEVTLRGLAALLQYQPAEREPIGINTHHLVADTATWRFLSRLADLARASGWPWLSAAEVFAAAPDRPLASAQPA